MRITGGIHRGRILKSPEGKDIRPTADKTRLAVFNMICSRGGLVDAHVLDVCCGTGALGLDALSRGAGQAVFMDISRHALDLARENARVLKMERLCHFIAGDAINPPPRGIYASADLVFMDPPYRKNMVPQIMRGLIAQDWVAPGALIVAETEQAAPDLIVDGFDVVQQKIHGAARMTLLRRV